MIIYDGNPVEVDKDKYAAFDWEKDIYSKKKVAALLGVKKKAVKASKVVTDRTSLVAIWGSKAMKEAVQKNDNTIIQEILPQVQSLTKELFSCAPHAKKKTAVWRSSFLHVEHVDLVYHFTGQ